MNEALIGDEITLVARARGQLLQLVLSATCAFLEAAEAEPSDLADTEQRLRDAMRELTGGDRPGLEARLVIVSGGLEIHLAPSGAPGSGAVVICPA